MTQIAALPTLTFQVAFDNDILDASPTWTDVESYVISFTTQMGRQHELDRVEASTLTAQLINNDGRFTPWSTASPYYSATPGYGLVPAKPCRILATWSATQYPVFYGFVDSWTPQPRDALYQECKLQASDVLKYLSLKYLSNASLYPNLVLASTPEIYLRLGDEPTSTLAADSSGNGYAAIASSVAFGSTTTPDTANSSGGSSSSQAGGFILYDPTTFATLGDATTAAGYLLLNQTATNALNGACTVECWVELPTGQTNTSYILGGTGDGQIQWNPSIGELFAESSDTGIGGIATVSATGIILDDGRPHHVVLTCTAAASGTMSLWVDGIEVASQAAPSTHSSTPFNDPSSSFGLGLTPGNVPGTPGFYGSMQDVAIYPAVLSGPTIVDHFNTGNMLRPATQYTGDRMADVLTIAGFGTFPAAIATGTVIVASDDPVFGGSGSSLSSTALDYMQSLADTEKGLLFQNASGVLTFYDRHYPQVDSNATTSNGTFGDNTSATYHYNAKGLAIAQDDLDLWTDVQVQSNIGRLQDATNATAVTAYGYRSLQKTSLRMASDSDAAILAAFLLFLYSTPQPRVTALPLGAEIDGGVDIPQMLGRGLWDCITVQRQGQGGETQLNQKSLIEQIAHTVDLNAGSWETVFALSPFEINPPEPFFIIGTSLLGSAVIGA